MSVGKPGYCKICDHAAAPFLNKKLADLGDKVFNAAKAQAFAAELDLTFNRQTWYGHVKHVTHPLVTLQKQALANPAVMPKTNTGALEAVRDIAIKRAIDNPEEVTIDHGLKALSILEGRKDKEQPWVVILAKAMTGELPETVPGEWRELPPDIAASEEEKAAHG